MFNVLMYSYLAVSVAILLLALASLVTALTGRWERTRLLAKLSVLGTGACLAVGLLFLVVAFGAVANADGATKATAIAKTISEAMNCSVYWMIGTPIGAILWYVARRKLRGARSAPN